MSGFRARGVALATAVLALAAVGCSKEEAPKTTPSATGGAAATAAGSGSAATAGGGSEASVPPAPGSGQGVLLRIVSGASFGTFSVYDGTGEKRLQEGCAPDTVVPLSTGRYTLFDGSSWAPYGRDVEVKVGATTEVRIGALKLVPVQGASFSTYAIYDATGEKRLRENNDASTAVSAGPGRYTLYDRSSWAPYGRDVEVKPGETTEVRIGAIKLVPVEGAAFSTYAIYDATGEKRLRENNDASTVVSAGPGRYTLYDRSSWAPYGRDVEVKPGETTEVRIGAIKLVPVEGAAFSTYAIYDATGEKRLRENNDASTAVSAGPGRYTLFDRSSWAPYGRDVEVKAGATTEVRIGALKVVLVPGAAFGTYAVYDATAEKRLRENNEPDRPVGLGPGRYTLFDRSSWAPYGRDIEVKAGETTVVPLGAIRGPSGGPWSIYDAAGEKRLRETNEPGALVTAGPGRYLLRDRATGKDIGTVEVTAGAVTEVK